jgi:hypothetical protein
MFSGENERQPIRSYPTIEKDQRASPISIPEKACDQIVHCARSIGVARKGNLRAERQSGLNSVGIVKPGHDRRDVFADDTEDGERLPAMEHGLAKVLGGGVMRREVRIGQASSPPGFDAAGRAIVHNLKRWIGPVQHDRQGPRPAHGSSSANLDKTQVAPTDCLMDRCLEQLSETANLLQSSRELTQGLLGCSAYEAYPDRIHVFERPRY